MNWNLLKTTRLLRLKQRYYLILKCNLHHANGYGSLPKLAVIYLPEFTVPLQSLTVGHTGMDEKAVFYPFPPTFVESFHVQRELSFSSAPIALLLLYFYFSILHVTIHLFLFFPYDFRPILALVSNKSFFHARSCWNKFAKCCVRFTHS